MLIFIFSFNIFDTLGRWLAGQKFGAMGDTGVLILSYSRVIFIVTAFLVDYNVGPAWLTGDNADWFKLLNMFIFAFSNGFVST
jgi:hypothetical protein